MSDLNNTENTESEVIETDDEWTPPSREEWEATLARKNKADSEAASRKRWLRDLGYDPKTGQKLPGGSVAGSETEAAPADQTASASPARVDTAAIESAASAKATARVIGMVEAGVDPKSLDLVDKLIDPNEDFASQVEALKEKAPGLFKRTRTSNVADASAAGAGSKKTPNASPQSNSWEDIVRARFNKGDI